MNGERYNRVCRLILVYTVCQFWIQHVSAVGELCDYNKTLEYIRTNTSAADDHAVVCADYSPKTSFALLFQACPGVNYHWNQWKPLFKVQGDCTTLLKGQALISYVREWPIVGAIFMECINGTDIKVVELYFEPKAGVYTGSCINLRFGNA